MAEVESTNSTETIDRFSKENSWYFKSIDDHVQPAARKLLEEYSHIPPNDVDSHIYRMRDLLWSLDSPYPCIGEFKFLNFNLPKHPLYQRILSLLKSSVEPINCLDLGCCVAQELRSLAFAGVPSSKLYGTDKSPNFLTTSYALFNDKDSFEGTLVPGNIFDEDLFEAGDKWKGWEGKFGIMHAGLFLHLFDWDQQVVVCEKVVRLLEARRGVLFVGAMVGCEGGGFRSHGKQTKFWKKGEERQQYLHDEGTLTKLWEEVAKKTGTEGLWKIEGNLTPRKPPKTGDPSKGCTYFTGPGIGWFTFSVERL